MLVKNIQSVMIYLVCGYRRTGKDTLVNILNRSSPFRWLVYKKPGLTYDIFKPRQHYRKGIADSLKQEVLELYNIPIEDETKDQRIFTFNGNSVSPRDMWIYYGHMCITKDPYYFCKKVELNSFESEDTVNVITDWRTFDQKDYYLGSEVYGRYVVTIRLYRSVVTVPADCVTERHLDHETTDFLFVLNPNEFELACKDFPQYSDYIQVGYLN
jgi:hypothetical protein